MTVTTNVTDVNVTTETYETDVVNVTVTTNVTDVNVTTEIYVTDVVTHY